MLLLRLRLLCGSLTRDNVVDQRVPNLSEAGGVKKIDGTNMRVARATARELTALFNTQNGLTGNQQIDGNSIIEVNAPTAALTRMAKALKLAFGTAVVFVHTPNGNILKHRSSRPGRRRIFLGPTGQTGRTQAVTRERPRPRHSSPTRGSACTWQIYSVSTYSAPESKYTVP